MAGEGAQSQACNTKGERHSVLTYTQVMGPHFIVHTSSYMPVHFASSAIQCSPSAECRTSHDGCSQFWEHGPVGLDDESFQRHFD